MMWESAVAALSYNGVTPATGVETIQTRWKMDTGGIVELSTTPKWKNLPSGITHMILLTPEGSLLFKQKLRLPTTFGDIVSFDR